MKKSEFTLAEKNIPVYKWEPDGAASGQVCGVFQIVHGSCEHAQRYENFASFLTEQGWIVFASDLRGHGPKSDKADLGYFGDVNGWRAMVDELHEVNKYIRLQYPDLQVVMFGHSMGSFLARHYAMLYGSQLSALILCGTAHYARSALRLGRLLAKREIRTKGIRHRSAALYNLTYRTFNRRYQPARTSQDWLTRDHAEVDKFLQDEYCGFVFTAGGFLDLFEGLLFITKKSNITMTPKDLPILFISGEDDPVGQFGKTVKQACHLYKGAGMTDVKLKLYEGMRHEILNEVGREEVYEDILAWLKF